MLAVAREGVADEGGQRAVGDGEAGVEDPLGDHVGDGNSEELLPF